ncbi:ribokinase [Cellulomonas hominis]
MSGRVVVVGSANVDTAVRVARIPGPGETVLARSLVRSGGGKGANQAVGAARAGGARTSFIGCLGDDADGALLRELLARDGVEADLVRSTDEAATGVALISVDDDGENSIVVAAGANGTLHGLDAEQRARVAAADVVLAQLEVPVAAVLAAGLARRPGALLVLNAAPSAPLPPELWAEVDVLVVNEHEAADLAGTGTGEVAAATRTLLGQVPCIVVTLGSAGAVLARRDRADVRLPAPRTSAVDTTGAGDTFCGVLAAALATGADLVEAVRLASAAGSLAVERPGAQDAVPTHDRVLARRRQAYPSGSATEDHA